MFKKPENLCEFDMSKFQPKNHWHDEIYLGDDCRERFLTQSDFPELVDNQVFMAGLTVLQDEYHVERSGPSIHTLLFTLEGRGALITKDSVQLIEANSVTILPAHQPFRFEILDPKVGWKMSWMLLNDVEKWQPLINGGQRIEVTPSCEPVWSLLNLLHIEVGGRTSYRKLFVSELSRLLIGSANQDVPSNTILRVQSVFNDVESQLHHPWSVKAIAKQSFISVEQLNRICKQLYGCTTQQRLIALRMEKATDLLHYQDWTIGMIAQRLGYPDPFNFTHRFRQYHGCSPRDYRRQLTQP